MRSYLFLFFCTLIAIPSCTNNHTPTGYAGPKAEGYVQVMPDFQVAFDSLGLEGSVLIYNPEKKTYYSNNFQWARTGQLPASTFKIPNSIIALETGVIASAQVILPWDGEQRSIENWNQDLTFAEAFAYSCVPCYQEIARSIGYDRMRNYLDKIGYPNTVHFDESNIDLFWLTGDARINQFEQIKFLKRLYENELPISYSTAQTLRKIMVIDTTNSYILSGKTGWSTDQQKNNGWFVGFVERREKKGAQGDGNILYFATNIEPKEGTRINSFIDGRRTLTEAAITSLNWP